MADPQQSPASLTDSLRARDIRQCLKGNPPQGGEDKAMDSPTESIEIAAENKEDSANSAERPVILNKDHGRELLDRASILKKLQKELLAKGEPKVREILPTPKAVCKIVIALMGLEAMMPVIKHLLSAEGVVGALAKTELLVYLSHILKSSGDKSLAPDTDGGDGDKSIEPDTDNCDEDNLESMLNNCDEDNLESMLNNFIPMSSEQWPWNGSKGTICLWNCAYPM
ncbi:hypothetical protein BT96DRAFT_949347 [Gymnopus androsaceus JB14]|uniref:Uncharacterized protein n=1 Tax=Gymnopus androsaceus JB14 TaxID=1447944 RepID=A0A6A4GLE5_9AGAR|nr:hypothetical protein BT96DRAFT_949347 [Gymnopus androsaceus JB14]